MARQLKRWESPRREGRNNKGKGGSARQRQLKKQQQMLRKKLKEQSESDNQKQQRGGKNNSSPIFLEKISHLQRKPLPVRYIYPAPKPLRVYICVPCTEGCAYICVHLRLIIANCVPHGQRKLLYLIKSAI